MLGCITMVDRLTCAKNQVRLLTKINQELDEELHKSIQKNTAQGIIISTLEVTVGQQDIRIKKLEAQVKELQGWSFEKIIDKIYGDYNLESPTGRGMIKYPFNPEGEPQAYPYTHPIREVPPYSRVKVK